MKTTRMWTLLLGLGILVSMAAAAEEPAAEPVFVARLPALDHSFWHLPSARETAPPAKASPSLVTLNLAPELWTPKKAATAAIADLAKPAGPDSAPRFSFVLRHQESQAFQTTPLPRPLPPTAFRHSRVRGPFEQVYPRTW